MGEPNIGSETRDLVAEIICNAMTPNQRSGGVTEKHYAVADAVLAAIGSLDATGDAMRRAAELDEDATVRVSGKVLHGGPWLACLQLPCRDVIIKYGGTPLAAIMAALAAAEDGR